MKSEEKILQIREETQDAMDNYNALDDVEWQKLEAVEVALDYVLDESNRYENVLELLKAE